MTTAAKEPPKVRAKAAGKKSGKDRKKPSPRNASRYLFDDSEWTFETLQRTYDAIGEVALDDLGLDIYPNQIEIISSEQMLDAYASHGMPLMYRHWSFGKRFVREEQLYRKGYMGLAYEIAINSNPCITYNMEENTMAMQALVMAHAAFGHNHFFKNNYLFRQWTDAEGILDYLQYAKGYVAECEERHGLDAVEEILDSAHALMDQGVFRYRRRPKLSLRQQKQLARERQEHEDRTFNDLWRTVPGSSESEAPDEDAMAVAGRKTALKLPEENLLYFLEKNSPVLEPWQRELLRIIRNIAQYFYPQRQTKMMNEGCAVFVHHTIISTLHEKRLLTDGALLEMLHSHTNVVLQPAFDSPHYNGINPYALGFAMMTDIKRICTEPEDEDRAWFPEIAGCGDWCGALKDAWVNYRDESFISQYLSPRLIREMRLFALADDSAQSHYAVGAIHDERGYRDIRASLARSYDLSSNEPDIQVVDVDLRGDRVLCLRHTVRDGIPLADKGRNQVLAHVRQLWGYEVTLLGIDADTDKTLYELSTAKQDDEKSD
jgi:spore cortex formation protein SpoVR/YcgB (stage V sporulation)